MIEKITEKQLHPNTPQNNGAATPAAARRRVLAVLSLLMGFAAISTDLSLPAMPMMSHDLGADAGMVSSRSAPAPSPPWSVRFSTAAASSAPDWSVSLPTAHPGRWAG